MWSTTRRFAARPSGCRVVRDRTVRPDALHQHLPRVHAASREHVADRLRPLQRPHHRPPRGSGRVPASKGPARDRREPAPGAAQSSATRPQNAYSTFPLCRGCAKRGDALWTRGRRRRRPDSDSGRSQIDQRLIGARTPPRPRTVRDRSNPPRSVGSAFRRAASPTARYEARARTARRGVPRRRIGRASALATAVPRWRGGCIGGLAASHPAPLEIGAPARNSGRTVFRPEHIGRSAPRGMPG
jgi:hypothetical protein